MHCAPEPWRLFVLPALGPPGARSMYGRHRLAPTATSILMQSGGGRILKTGAAPRGSACYGITSIRHSVWNTSCPACVQERHLASTPAALPSQRQNPLLPHSSGVRRPKLEAQHPHPLNPLVFTSLQFAPSLNSAAPFSTGQTCSVQQCTTGTCRVTVGCGPLAASQGAEHRQTCRSVRLLCSGPTAHFRDLTPYSLVSMSMLSQKQLHTF
jgi:hypothetical protein